MSGILTRKSHPRHGVSFSSLSLLTIGLLAVFSLFAPPVHPEEPEVSPRLNLSAATLHPGEVLLVTVEGVPAGNPPTLRSSAGSFPGFSYVDGRWMGLLGFSSAASPGVYPLQVFFGQGDGSLRTLAGEITLAPRSFPSERLQLPPKQMEKRAPAKQAEDGKKVSQAKSAPLLPPLWDGPFIYPVRGRISTGFGFTRYLNGVEETRHSGMDIAAVLGTSVLATNNGTVTLVGELNMTGNTVVIAHGLGLYSSYAHLDRILVRQGETVKKGQVIGAVGSTGVSTGPHLHWTFSVGTTFVDPVFMVENPLGNGTAATEGTTGE